MIKLFAKQDKEKEKSLESKPLAPSKLVQKTSSVELRLQKDIGELSLPKTVKMDFPNPDDLLNFDITISPDEGFLKIIIQGLYRNGHFHFTFKFPKSYPFDPPKVKCTKKIFHPNIDLAGNVCLNILREDWKPVLNINSIVYGLQFLLLEPNADDPLNKGENCVDVYVEAAEMLRNHKDKYAEVVGRTMKGYSYNGQSYDKVV